MKIAIDLSQIIYGTGVSHYRENLVRNLLKINMQSLVSGSGKENEYLLFGGSLRRKKELEQKINKLGSNLNVKVFPIPPTLANLVWNKLHILPIEKLIGEVDLVHTSDWAEPPTKISKVTTIHDLIPIKFPKLTPRVIVETHRERLRWVAKESKRIIVPSLCTKSDLISLGFDEEKIRVIPEAPNLSKASEKEVEAVKKKYGIHENYITTIGANSRKNIKRIIEGYHLSKAGRNLKLIVVGEMIGSKLLDERGVRFLGHVDDSDLEALLTGSKALVFASIYEGFGIPILDAFNCCVPVVTSNVSSMPEVSGGAAILVDPYDVNSIADGITESLEKPKTLIDKGLKRVKDFSWQQTAEETLKVYKEII
jgi:glycosyltransferase involved in cell wall biosynthesis